MTQPISAFAAMTARSTNQFEDLQKGSEKQETQKTDHSDDRFYYPETDEQGNGGAMIRFLPTAEGDTVPFMKFFGHSKQFNGGWYITECQTTIGGDCPMCKENDVLWKSGDAGKAEVRDKRKRAMRYVANILVVKDPKNPENEGKRFLYRFGFKIHAKLMEALNGVVDELEPENTIPPCNVFDLFQGKNFSMKIQKVDGQTNYDKSTFAKQPTPLHTYDGKKAVKWEMDALEKLWNSQYSIKKDYADGLVYNDFAKDKLRLDKVQGREVVETADGVSNAGGSIEGKSSGKISDVALEKSLEAPTSSAAASPTDEDSFFDNM